MAANASTTDAARWESANYNRLVARKAWVAVAGEDDCQARRLAATALYDAQRTQFSTPAPSISALADKLTIWWGRHLPEDTFDSSLNRRVIGDLRRLELEAAGVPHSEASGRMMDKVEQDAAAWRAALAEYNEQQQLFMEGPSPRWEGRDSSDMFHAVHCAIDNLLALPAPNLGGVIKKLEIMWEFDRFETIEDGAIYVHVMRDLNGLVNQQRADAGERE
ncbi:hypothetical protein OKA06_01475 [Novosphingobium sp. MW5]|nr:hypothetical protein [Novosphingobium sp. MW5]